MTVQLIGKDDSSFDDSEVLSGRWQSYIESFVSVSLIWVPMLCCKLIVFDLRAIRPKVYHRLKSGLLICGGTTILSLVIAADHNVGISCLAFAISSPILSLVTVLKSRFVSGHIASSSSQRRKTFY